MGRYLLPGLAALQARGELPQRFEVVGAARDDWDDGQYRNWAADWLRLESDGVEPLLEALRYERLDLDAEDGAAPFLAGQKAVAVYLALPPSVFPAAVSALYDAGLPD